MLSGLFVRRKSRTGNRRQIAPDVGGLPERFLSNSNPGRKEAITTSFFVSPYNFLLRSPRRLTSVDVAGGVFVFGPPECEIGPLSRCWGSGRLPGRVVSQTLASPRKLNRVKPQRRWNPANGVGRNEISSRDESGGRRKKNRRNLRENPGVGFESSGGTEPGLCFGFPVYSENRNLRPLRNRHF